MQVKSNLFFMILKFNFDCFLAGKIFAQNPDDVYVYNVSIYVDCISSLHYLFALWKQTKASSQKRKIFMQMIKPLGWHCSTSNMCGINYIYILYCWRKCKKIILSDKRFE